MGADVLAWAVRFSREERGLDLFLRAPFKGRIYKIFNVARDTTAVLRASRTPKGHGKKGTRSQGRPRQAIGDER